MHPIHTLREYRRLATSESNDFEPFRCSCGSVYLESLAFGAPEDDSVYFWCAEEDYSTPVGLKAINKAQKALDAFKKETRK